MSSYGESKLSGDPNSKKPKGVKTASSQEPIKLIGESGVSSGLTIGDPNLKKAKGEAAVSSSSPTKPIGKTGLSSGLSIGDPNSKKPNSQMILTANTGFSSGVSGKAAVSSGVRGKAIVSDNIGEVMSFREVTFGPHEGEVRFWLIHFWEARNARTKVRIGLEMLLINEERKKGQFTSAKSSNEDSASSGSGWGSGQSWALDGTESQKPEAFEKSTPMMRCGPGGPRTLCNACGLMWANKGTLRDLSKAPPPPAETHNLPINKIYDSILEAELAGEISNSR